ncbi:MAG: hypothetical protein IJH47_05895 [Oscillospiraceae bacterium]|nr:hypothetical protein [Oscillospiraceae bacterium]
MNEEITPARRVILKGLAAGVVYSLVWVMSNHWFFHAWDHHWLGVILLVFAGSLLSWSLPKSPEQDVWGRSFCVAVLVSFSLCLCLLTLDSPPLKRFLFAWHPSSDTRGEFTAKGAGLIDLLCLGGKVMTCLYAALFYREKRLRTNSMAEAEVDQ